MATRKVKRYDDGGTTDDMYGDLEGAMDKANARAVQDQFDANEAAGSETVKKPSAQKLRSVGDSLINKARTEAKAEAKAAPMSNYSNENRRPEAAKPSAPTTRVGRASVPMKAAPDEMKLDKAAMDTANERRSKMRDEAFDSPLMRLLRNNNSQRSKAYRKDDGMKNGGMTKSSASSRADGIASKGKTRGKIC